VGLPKGGGGDRRTRSGAGAVRGAAVRAVCDGQVHGPLPRPVAQLGRSADDEGTAVRRRLGARDALQRRLLRLRVGPARPQQADPRPARTAGRRRALRPGTGATAHSRPHAPPWPPFAALPAARARLLRALRGEDAREPRSDGGRHRATTARRAGSDVAATSRSPTPTGSRRSWSSSSPTSSPKATSATRSCDA
jgi:hypothetical protein